ncbi:MAG: alpha/beta hydrolase [Oscillospiraceae bacterium]
MIPVEKLIQKAEILREEYKKECQAFHWEKIEVGSAEELNISVMESGVPTRILLYTPIGAAAEAERRPLYISIHGGAFIRGSADFDDYFCRKTANEVGCKVINIDFKLAPEYKFPYSAEECYRVLAWAAENAAFLGIDADRISIGGHNSGGTIAAVAAQLARDRGGAKLRCMLLDGPVVNLESGERLLDFDLDRPLAGPQKAAFFNTCYMGDVSNASSPMASPICLQDLTGLPDTFVLTAGEDPLTPETERYVQRLRQAGVEVEYARMEGCKHGFTVRAGLASEEKFEKAWSLMNGYLKKKLQ